MYLPSPGRPVCGPVQARAAGTGFEEVAVAEALLDAAAVGDAVPDAEPLADAELAVVAEGVADELAEGVAEALPGALLDALPDGLLDGVQPVRPRPSTPKLTAPRPKVPTCCKSSRRPMEARAEEPATARSAVGSVIAD